MAARQEKKALLVEVTLTVRVYVGAEANLLDWFQNFWLLWIIYTIKHVNTYKILELTLNMEGSWNQSPSGFYHILSFFRKIRTVVIEESKIIFWSDLNADINYTCEVCQFKRDIFILRKLQFIKQQMKYKTVKICNYKEESR